MGVVFNFHYSGYNETEDTGYLQSAF